MHVYTPSYHCMSNMCLSAQWTGRRWNALNISQQCSPANLNKTELPLMASSIVRNFREPKDFGIPLFTMRPLGWDKSNYISLYLSPNFHEHQIQCNPMHNICIPFIVPFVCTANANTLYISIIHNSLQLILMKCCVLFQLRGQLWLNSPYIFIMLSLQV